MSALQNNPFYKSNPYQLSHFQKFAFPHYPTSNPVDYNHLIYRDSYRPQQSRISDNTWNFNQNNLTKRVDFTKKYENNLSQVTDFEVRMKASSIYSTPINHHRIPQVKEFKKENPFYRKNLVINRQAVANQIQLDLYNHRVSNVYDKKLPYELENQVPLRNRVSSAYQNVGRASFGGDKPAQIPPLKKNSSRRSQEPTPRNLIKSLYIQQPQELSYSKTPQITSRIPQIPQQQEANPKTLQYGRKTFFLHPVTSN